MRFLKRIATGIKNLWVWLPIIWNDRQWDCSFLYRLLAHKLYLMQSFWESDKPVGFSAPMKRGYIKACVERADRLAKDDYLSVELDRIHHREKWGHFDFLINPADGRWFGVWHEKAENYEQNDQADEEFLLASRLSKIKKEQDRKVLFEILSQRIEYWWD